MASPASLSALFICAGIIFWRRGAVLARYVDLCFHAFVVECVASIKPLHKQHVF